MNLKEWKQFCRKAWEHEYDYLQKDRFGKKEACRYTKKNCNKTTYRECIPETKPFKVFYMNMIYSLKNKHETKDLDELEYLQSKTKQVRLVEKLGKQGFQYNIKKLFEPNTKAVTDGNQNLIRETKTKTKANEELDESNVQIKTLGLMNKKGVN